MLPLIRFIYDNHFATPLRSIIYSIDKRMTTFGHRPIPEFSLHGRGRIGRGGWRLADFHPQEEGTLTHIRGGKVEIKGRGEKIADLANFSSGRDIKPLIAKVTPLSARSDLNIYVFKHNNSFARN